MKFAATDKRRAKPARRPSRLERPTVIIGYGNLLRSDDGIGPAVVSRLDALFSDNPLCRCLTLHQLLPENAEAVSFASRVIFVDASVDIPPGRVKVRRLLPVRSHPPRLGHHVSPETILSLAAVLFGRSPKAWVVAVGVSNLEVGDRLSKPVSRAAARLTRHLAHRIRRWSHIPTSALPTRKVYHDCA